MFVHAGRGAEGLAESATSLPQSNPYSASTPRPHDPSIRRLRKGRSASDGTHSEKETRKVPQAGAAGAQKKAVPPPTGGHARLARVALGVLLTAAVIVAGLVVFTPKPDAPRSTAATVAVPKPAAPQPQAQPAPAQMPPVSPQAAPAPQVAAVPPAPKPAWQRNAVPVAVTGQPMIAVVIDDMGLDRKRSQRTVDLPGPLTLAYLAYAGDLATQTGAARAAGHESLVHVPMEPGSATTDPGQNALLTALSPEELARRIAWNLSQFSGSVGINNHMGSKATADREMMGTVMAALKARGMLFLDSRTSGETVAQDVALKSGIPGSAGMFSSIMTHRRLPCARRCWMWRRLPSVRGSPLPSGIPRTRRSTRFRNGCRMCSRAALSWCP